MRNRMLSGALLLIGALIPITSCNNSPSLTKIVVTPNVMNFGGTGLTTQLTATGYYTHPGHPPVTKDITTQVAWSTSTPDCVTVSSTGLITSGQNVCSNIPVTASMPGFNGLISGSMTVNVTQPSSGGGGGTGGGVGDVTSLAIIPASQTVASPGLTAQFLAIGTTSTGATENLTNQVAWSSSSVQIAIVSSTGVATGVAQGTATITALFTNADGTVSTGTASFTVSGGTSEPITGLTLLPASQSLSISQTGQFIAIGTSGKTGLAEDVTNAAQLAWHSSIPTVATVSSGLTTGNGLATGLSTGSTAIEAIWTNPDGSIVTASGAVTVSASAAPEPLLSLNIIPGDTTVTTQGQTQQYLAFGTFSTAPTIRDLTNQVDWIALDPQVASIETAGTAGATAGLATAEGYTGNGVIYATTTNPDGTVVLSNPVTFTCKDPITNVCNAAGSGYPSTYVTLTVYNLGTNNTDWLVTAPSVTGSANLIHCGPGWTGSGGSVCIGTYPYGATVTLTESGSNFNGWSFNCENPPGTPNLTNTCTIKLNTNDAVGVIFN